MMAMWDDVPYCSAEGGVFAPVRIFERFHGGIKYNE